MISEGRWEVRERGGRRWITLVTSRANLEIWLAARPDAAERFEWDHELSCRCCGVVLVYDTVDDIPPRAQQRCQKHVGRNPCAIEGCKRTTAAPSSGAWIRYADDQWFCGEHWRRLVPARSRMRRAYHRLWRQADAAGWRAPQGRRFHQFWDRLVRLARQRAERGFIDEVEIGRIMGWTE